MFVFKSSEEGLGLSASRAGWEASVDQMESTEHSALCGRNGLSHRTGQRQALQDPERQEPMPVKDLNLNSVRNHIIHRIVLCIS